MQLRTIQLKTVELKQKIFTCWISKALAISSIVGASLLVPAVAMANALSESEVALQLWAIAAELGLQNSDLSDVRMDDLDRGYYHNVNLTLRSGRTHVLIGVCDTDCLDMDFKLYDENGNLLKQDIAPDAYPTVSISPRWTGDFTLRVSMPRCSTHYCSYGVGLFN